LVSWIVKVMGIVPGMIVVPFMNQDGDVAAGAAPQNIDYGAVGLMRGLVDSPTKAASPAATSANSSVSAPWGRATAPACNAQRGRTSPAPAASNNLTEGDGRLHRGQYAS
jgi:hypothetical protein